MKELESYKKKGKLLDIGCYTGFFLELARDNGWEVEGLDPSNWASEYARKNFGLKVQSNLIENMDFPENNFDVITMWDVIEHLTNPIIALKKIQKILKSDGVFILTTYLMDSWEAKLLKSKYPFLMKMHLIHFTRKTLNYALEESGFEVLEIRTHIRILRLSYFIGRFKAYNKTISKILLKLVNILHIADWTIRVPSLGLVTVFAKPNKKRIDMDNTDF